MFRYLAVLTVLMAAPTGALAACGSWGPGGILGPGPHVAICFKGDCEQTALVLECTGATGYYGEYANGWGYSVDYEDGRLSVSRGDIDVPADAVTCDDVNGGAACGPLPSRS